MKKSLPSAQGIQNGLCSRRCAVLCYRMCALWGEAFVFLKSTQPPQLGLSSRWHQARCWLLQSWLVPCCSGPGYRAQVCAVVVQRAPTWVAPCVLLVLSSWCSTFLRVSRENGHVTVSHFHRPMETQCVKQLIRESPITNWMYFASKLHLFFSARGKKISNSNHFEVSFVHSLGDLACKILIKKNISC